MFTKRIWGCEEKTLSQTIFPVPPKKGSSGTRDVTITLDRTRHQARPLLLVVSRLIIEAGGSVTQGNTPCLLSRPTHHRWLSWGFEIERTERNFPFTDT